MLVNADFSRSAIVASHSYQWVASPQGGIERVMLDRLGGETARATSIVRYAPETSFPSHPHPGGEEILVLSGTLSEEDQHYPAGWYLRNPPGSSHQPSSHEGALIFVKLWQMKPDEKDPVRIDTNDPRAWQQQDSREICPLFSGEDEQVCLLRLQPGDPLFTQSIDSAELLVLSGHIETVGQAFERGSWIRLPPGAYPDITAGSQGATVYLKTGHLLNMPVGI
ncbi:cupin domain-containing protein [Pseudomonas sp. B21-056]|uniref:cupin domain-containing protein n=1 Tax=Pseudomonas sp. B21-056 TaxID=2895495 RepID=UPI0022304B43|nr:cupin domain-containing protein [Pseudomonas sp. B21-056]UZE25789.1 cupin domain-containing protein [Pseudomonas sp. B21-056]